MNNTSCATTSIERVLYHFYHINRVLVVRALEELAALKKSVKDSTPEKPDNNEVWKKVFNCDVQLWYKYVSFKNTIAVIATDFCDAELKLSNYFKKDFPQGVTMVINNYTITNILTME